MSTGVAPSALIKDCASTEWQQNRAEVQVCNNHEYEARIKPLVTRLQSVMGLLHQHLEVIPSCVKVAQQEIIN